jgi:hypothetical protein
MLYNFLGLPVNSDTGHSPRVTYIKHLCIFVRVVFANKLECLSVAKPLQPRANVIKIVRDI